MTSEANPHSESTREFAAPNIWIRGLYMLLFVLIYGAAEIVLLAVTLFQFGSSVLTEERNPRLLRFAESLSEFIYQIVVFWTFVSDEKPFPFAEWPQGHDRSTSP